MADRPEPTVDTLPFLVVDQAEDEATMGVFSRTAGDLTVRPIPVAVLRDNLRATVDSLRSVFQELAEDAGGLRLREVQVGFEVSASGGVNLVGTATVGTKGAITLTFGQ